MFLRLTVIRDLWKELWKCSVQGGFPGTSGWRALVKSRFTHHQISNLKPSSVAVIHNASYHSVKVHASSRCQCTKIDIVDGPCLHGDSVCQPWLKTDSLELGNGRKATLEPLLDSNREYPPGLAGKTTSRLIGCVVSRDYAKNTLKRRGWLFLILTKSRKAEINKPLHFEDFWVLTQHCLANQMRTRRFGTDQLGIIASS